MIRCVAVCSKEWHWEDIKLYTKIIQESWFGWGGREFCYQPRTVNANTVARRSRGQRRQGTCREISEARGDRRSGRNDAKRSKSKQQSAALAWHVRCGNRKVGWEKAPSNLALEGWGASCWNQPVSPGVRGYVTRADCKNPSTTFERICARHQIHIMRTFTLQLCSGDLTVLTTCLLAFLTITETGLVIISN